MKLTQEQKEIVQSNSRITLVNAYAGTGKTSTLVEYCKARSKSKMLYLAYNASMAKEAKKKFVSLDNISCATIHSLALRSMPKELEPYRERLGKTNLKSIDLLPYFEKDKHQYYFANLLMRLFKRFINSKDTIEEVINQSSGDDAKVAKLLPRLWGDILSLDSLPFEHDFYLKMYQLSKPNLSEFDYILVDEAQDLNPVMFDIVHIQTSKQVYIGDTFQKIYGFRNCINALEMLKDHKEASIFYLTHTFRCPSYIVEYSNPYLFLLGANKPLIGKNEQYDPSLLPKHEKKECIICRTNARVFDYVVSNPDVKFHFIGGIKGYNFSDMLDIALLHSKNTDNRRFIQNPFYTKFADAKELLEYIKASNEVEAKTRLMIFYKYAKTHNLFKIIRSLKHYPLKQADYIITSAHKSKGLEWDFVRIEDDFLDINKVNEAKELPVEIPREELNLLYVALTRAKKDMEVPEEYKLKAEQISHLSQKIVIIDT